MNIVCFSAHATMLPITNLLLDLYDEYEEEDRLDNEEEMMKEQEEYRKHEAKRARKASFMDQQFAQYKERIDAKQKDAPPTTMELAVQELKAADTFLSRLPPRLLEQVIIDPVYDDACEACGKLKPRDEPVEGYKWGTLFRCKVLCFICAGVVRHCTLACDPDISETRIRKTYKHIPMRIRILDIINRIKREQNVKIRLKNEQSPPSKCQPLYQPLRKNRMFLLNDPKKIRL